MSQVYGVDLASLCSTAYVKSFTFRVVTVAFPCSSTTPRAWSSLVFWYVQVLQMGHLRQIDHIRTRVLHHTLFVLRTCSRVLVHKRRSAGLCHLFCRQTNKEDSDVLQRAHDSKEDQNGIEDKNNIVSMSLKQPDAGRLKHSAA